MKKILIVFLVIDILLLMCYCTITNEKGEIPVTSEGAVTTATVVTTPSETPKTTVAQGTTADTTPEEKPSSGYFASYESILELCRLATENFDYEYETVERKANELFGSENSTEKEWFWEIYNTLSYYLASNHSESNYKQSLGYAMKDLNGDGINELVLINDSYVVGAIFSMVNGKPILLDSYIPRGSCWIDADGQLHINGSGGARCWSNGVYQIAKGGASLVLIAEFGADNFEFSDEQPYYRLVNGEMVNITKAEHDALEEEYGAYLGWEAGAAATKEKAGLLFEPLFVDAAMAAFERMLNLEIPVYDTRKDAYVFYLDKCMNDVDGFYYTIMDIDGDSVNEFMISGADTLLFRYYQGVVYLYSFSVRQMDTLFTDGTARGHHQGADSYESRGYRMSFEGKKLKQETLWEYNYDLTTKETRYVIEGQEVSQEEYHRYCEGKVSVRFSLMLNRSETCLTQDVQDTWEDDFGTLLSGLETHDPDAVGIFDLNFDNIPEVLLVYPNGSVCIYNLKNPKEPIWVYYGISDSERLDDFCLTVAKTGDEYVVLAEGALRGHAYTLELLSNLDDLETKLLEAKELFGVGDLLNDTNQYFYMGEPVEKSKYDEEYQKFLNDYTVFEETEISLVFWQDYNLSNREQLVRDMVNSLLHSKQQFINYKK